MDSDVMTAVDHIIHQAEILNPCKGPRQWSQEEDQFLLDNYLNMTDAQIGQKIGRGAAGVHIRRERHFDLTAPSKTADVLTSYQAALMLGIDSHKLAYWVDCGLIRSIFRPTAPTIRIIRKIDFLIWCMNTNNWIYFDIHKVANEKLRWLLEQHQKRWGDEWWTTPQVARYHGTDVHDVKRYIKLGYLEAIRIPVSFGGRDPNGKWSYWRVLRSDALRVRFYRGHYAMMDRKWTAAADSFLIKAVEELHIKKAVIARMMKKPSCSIFNRYKQLKERINERGKK